MHYRDESTGAQCTTLCPFHENTHHDCVLIKSHYGICSRSGSISHFLCINQRCPSGSATLSSGSRDLLQQSGVPEEPIRGSVMDSQRCLYTWLKCLLCRRYCACLEDCSGTSSDTCERLVGLQSQRKKVSFEFVAILQQSNTSEGISLIVFSKLEKIFYSIHDLFIHFKSSFNVHLLNYSKSHLLVHEFHGHQTNEC